MGDLLWILVSAMLVNNFTLTLFLGLCSFVGVTQKMGTAVRLGLANTFVMLITSVAAYALNTWVPDYDLVVVILNEPGFGGCGGGGFQIVTQ